MRAMRDLPPLAAVRAFEAAARHLSFTRAAAELGMTQAAVSYQIRLLEERLGVALFLRQPQQVVLTEAGQRLAGPVSDAFAGLRAAFAALRDTADGTLAISAVHTFAANWLVPRLGAFQLAHPAIAVRLDTSPHFVDFAREEFDLALRAGIGPWPGLEAHRLFPVTYTPMCSPAFLARLGGRPRPEDLLRLPLISPDDVWWSRWLLAAGVERPLPAEMPALRLGNQQMEGAAALSGNGFAMLTPAFFEDELAAGRLVQPFDLVLVEASAYWLVYPHARRHAAKIRAFRDWLLAEVRRAEAVPAGNAR